MVHPDDNEEELIQRCLRGEGVFQKRLYDKYARKMFAVCLRYSKDHDQAKDWLQEGFIKLFTHLHTFRGTGAFEGWMRRIFVNLALEDIRKNMRGITTTDLDSADQVPYTDHGFQKLSVDELMGLVQKLPDGYRTVFNLFGIEGYSHKEIAEMLGISENTSKTQLLKARLQLQRMLKELQIVRSK